MRPTKSVPPLLVVDEFPAPCYSPPEPIARPCPTPRVIEYQPNLPPDHGPVSYDTHSFWTVQFAYLTRVFRPIAAAIGLTPEAAYCMTVQMGLPTLQDIVRDTERPLCGYRASEAPSGIPAAPLPDRPAGWGLYDLARLAKVHTNHWTRSNRAVEIDFGVLRRAMSAREKEAVRAALREMHAAPWIVDADYRRLAHQYIARRSVSNKAVAASLGMHEVNETYLEKTLFDWRGLDRMGYAPELPGKNIRPRHISQNQQIKDLVLLVQEYYHGDFAFRQDFWEQIEHRLFSRQNGPYLGPVLKRFAVSPIPEQPTGVPYERSEHTEYRKRIMEWIIETVNC